MLLSEFDRENNAQIHQIKQSIPNDIYIPTNADVERRFKNQLDINLWFKVYLSLYFFCCFISIKFLGKTISSLKTKSIPIHPLDVQKSTLN